MATTKQKIKLHSLDQQQQKRGRRRRGGVREKLEILHSHSNNAIQIGSKIKWSSASAATTAEAAAATKAAKTTTAKAATTT